MKKTRRDIKQEQRGKKAKHRLFIGIILTALFVVGITWKVVPVITADKPTTTQQNSSQKKKNTKKNATTEKEAAKPKKVTITASGDMLYHDILFRSAFDGERYDLDNDYAQLQPILEKADLSLGDFEGTINPNRELSGYPSFNAPKEVAESIKAAGFDVVDLAHNHILDTGLEGLKTTVDTFKDLGVDTIGVKTDRTEDILIKEVNGIKIALLAYCYGFNGLESTITTEEYNAHLKDLNMDKIAADLQKAEEMADITIVMPQAGEEYSLEPTEEQTTTYRRMIDLGADIIFGGHPHVPEPTEIIEKDGERKFILYSMGNLISDQRFESLQNYWTERGVLMEVEITKDQAGTKLTNVLPHPTWVSKDPIPGRTYQHPTYGTVQSQDYQVHLAEDYLPGGKNAGNVDETTRQRIETAYHEVMELLNLQW